jgi:hypothetical protein
MTWVAVTTVLVFLTPVAALVTGLRPPAFEPGSAGAAGPSTLLAWSVLSNALIAAVLAALAVRSAAAGWRRVAGLFAVAFGAGQLAGVIEAWVFHVIDGATSLRLLAMSAIVSGAAAAVAAALAPARKASQIAWRPGLAALALVSGLYVAAYWSAGVLVFPFVEAFYTTRGLPSTPLVIALQLLVRGPLFAVILAWLVSSTRGSRAERAAWAGVTLAVIGGLAPLLIPNPYFTDAVRWAHLVETSTSNLLFGALAGWILQRRDNAGAAMSGVARQSA